MTSTKTWYDGIFHLQNSESWKTGFSTCCGIEPVYGLPPCHQIPKSLKPHSLIACPHPSASADHRIVSICQHHGRGVRLKAYPVPIGKGLCCPMESAGRRYILGSNTKRILDRTEMQQAIMNTMKKGVIYSSTQQ